MTPSSLPPHDLAIVGAGPVGIELAVSCKRAAMEVVHFDAGQIGQTMFNWPPGTRWFSSSDRIAIAGVPIQSTDQSKCTREEYLAYLRAVVMQFDCSIRTYERVLELQPDDGGFVLTSATADGRRHRCRAGAVVLATGGNAWPNPLGVPGEDLPHVSHHLDDPHKYFRRRVVVVGGRNSAVEAALRAHHAGAAVTLSYRGTTFPRSVKYWLRPEIEHLIETGAIEGHFGTVPSSISPAHVVLEPVDGGAPIEVATDFVLLMTGYVADMELFRQIRVQLDTEQERPTFDPATMETNIPRLFVAGTAVAGTQRSGVRVFLENCHIHVDRIVAALTGASPPADPDPVRLAEA